MSSSLAANLQGSLGRSDLTGFQTGYAGVQIEEKRFGGSVEGRRISRELPHVLQMGGDSAVVTAWILESEML
jgi:hypothetical protein